MLKTRLLYAMILPIICGAFRPQVGYHQNPLSSSSYLECLEKRGHLNYQRRERSTRQRKSWQDRRTIIAPHQFGNFTEDLFAHPEEPRISVPITLPVWANALTSEYESGDNGLRNQTQVRFPFPFPRNARPSPKKSVSSENNNFRLEDDTSLFNFTCVGGYPEVKKELAQIIDFIRRPENYTRYGVRLPRGVLLEGPTGNGKTLISKCLAGEAGVNFVSCAGSEFTEKYIGVGAARIRELFAFVKSNAPCILFIDEFDALGRKRSSEGESSNSERDQTLNQLLVLMDGFQPNEGTVMVMAATNRRDVLDPAAIRPGRFDKIIHVPNPDSVTRKAIIDIHSTNKPLNFSTLDLVKITNGFNGAQIENILNEATLYAIRTNSLPVNMTHLQSVRERILVGQSSSAPRNISDKVLRRIATHEVGHLLMALQSSCYDRPSKISIDSINPKQSLGYVIFDADESDEDFMLREYIQDKIKVLLGGRAAEEVMYGTSVSSGAVSDLEKAFILAKTMVMNYGMGTKLIFPYLSEIYKRQIDENIHVILFHLYGETLRHIRSNRTKLDTFVEILLVKKTLEWEEIKTIYDGII